MKSPIPPHGGVLVNLQVSPEQENELRARALELPSLFLDQRQQCDLELLMNGGFSPLRGFMGKPDYEGCLHEMRLASGALWPIPITLDVDDDQVKLLEVGEEICLRDKEGLLLAIFRPEEIWKPNKREEALAVFGTDDLNHLGVACFMHWPGTYYVGGTIRGVSAPKHFHFQKLRHSPVQLREVFKEKGWEKVVAFQTANPMHRVHEAITRKAIEDEQAHLLVHPSVGPTKTGDIHYITRIRCYRNMVARYPENKAMLSLLPLAMRIAGPREALWHAIIRKNFGCSHLIVGNYHGSPSGQEDVERMYSSQELVFKHSEELGIRVLSFPAYVYVEEDMDYLPENEVAPGKTIVTVSSTELRQRLRKGLSIPEWLAYPEDVRELQRVYPPRDKMGLVIFFTCLSGSGKSTLAKTLAAVLQEKERPLTLLDGDILRTHLSNELGFSKEHRDIHIRRIGFVASEIAKCGGIAICAPIAPYSEARNYVRNLVSCQAAFLEIHVATPLAVCEERDPKGLYAKARTGIIKGFTGIDAPYEEPEEPEIRLDTTKFTVEGAVCFILDYMKRAGYLASTKGAAKKECALSSMLD